MNANVVKVPDVVGHRGFSACYPENTIISFEQAIASNASGIEGDIRLTKDNEIIMMHDTKLDRTTTGRGVIGKVDWHGYIDGITTKTDPPQRIPRFRDVLDLLVTKEVAEKNLYMIVDIKFDNPLEILEHLHRLLESKEYVKHKPTLTRTLIIGIWHTSFLTVAEKLFQDYQLCFIGLSLAAARTHFIHKVDYLSVPFAALCDKDGQEFIQQVHALNKKVATWTINATEQMRTCVVWHVDLVVGDHIPTMLKHIQHDVATLSAEEFKVYKETSTYLSTRRRRWYYSLVKIAMHHASRHFIGM